MDSYHLHVICLLLLLHLHTTCAAAAAHDTSKHGSATPLNKHLNSPTVDNLPLKSQNKKSSLQQNKQDLQLAFSAVCTQTVDYFPGSTVVFNDVITNDGGAYVNNTGQFVCVDDSVYLFIWSMVKATDEEVSGMRVIAKLQMGLDEIKFGPKTNYYQYNAGNAEMNSIVACRTSPVSAITVSIEPWLDNNLLKLVSEFPGFSGFRLGAPENIVAFVAELVNETYLFPGGKIEFDQVLQNYGGSYDPLTGTFTCPDNYTYVFTITTQTRDPETPWSVSRLMIEGEEILLGPVTYPATNEHDSGSASVTSITRCQLNKRVYVEAHLAQDFQYNSYAPRLTSFTGFRVHGQEEESVAFMACLAENITISDENEPIIMDKVLLNTGGAYDTLTGSFVCLDDKLYMFSYTATTESEGRVDSGIYMDGERIRRNRTTYTTMNATSGSSTTSVIICCQEGSRIHIMHEVSHNAAIFYLAYYTTFSGYKLPGQDI